MDLPLSLRRGRGIFLTRDGKGLLSGGRKGQAVHPVKVTAQRFFLLHAGTFPPPPLLLLMVRISGITLSSVCFQGNSLTGDGGSAKLSFGKAAIVSTRLLIREQSHAIMLWNLEFQIVSKVLSSAVDKGYYCIVIDQPTNQGRKTEA